MNAINLYMFINYQFQYTLDHQHTDLLEKDLEAC